MHEQSENICKYVIKFAIESKIMHLKVQYNIYFQLTKKSYEKQFFVICLFFKTNFINCILFRIFLCPDPAGKKLKMFKSFVFKAAIICIVALKEAKHFLFFG